MLERLRTLFAVDLRSLAVMRIGVGVLVLVDLVIRARDLRAFHTDAGIIPRAVLREHLLTASEWSLYMFSGAAGFVAVMFVLTGIAAIALIAGFHTRIATVVLWVLMLSVQVRNPFVLNGGDYVLRLLLFWGMFLPLGARYSLDARGKEPSLAHRYSSLATVGLILQVCAIYYFAALHKAHPVWIQWGTAVFYALSIDGLTTDAGRWLLQFPGLLKFLTFSVMFVEFLAPMAIVLPVKTRWVRTGALALLVVLHLGLLPFMKLGLFPFVCVAGVVGIAPALVWQRGDSTELSAPFKTWPTAARAGLGLLVVLLAYFNVVSVPRFSAVPYPKALQHVQFITGLNQHWAMYAPYPMVDDGRFEFRDDVGRDLAVDARFERERWSSFLIDLWQNNRPGDTPRDPQITHAFLEYLCREFSVGELRVYYHLDRTILPEHPAKPVETLGLWHHACGAPQMGTLLPLPRGKNVAHEGEDAATSPKSEGNSTASETPEATP